MTVEDILDEIETLVSDAQHVPFIDKSMIDENDLTRLVDDLRHTLPLEIDEARKILNQRETTIKEAEERAARIIANANSEASTALSCPTDTHGSLYLHAG